MVLFNIIVKSFKGSSTVLVHVIIETKTTLMTYKTYFY